MPACSKSKSGPAVSGPAANLVMEAAGQKKTFELKPLLGQKTVLLAFFTTWCPYCNQSMPYIEDFYRKNKDKGFEVVGIDIEETEKDAVDFVKKHGVTFPVLMGKQNDFSENYPVKYLPTLFLIGKNGEILKTFEGFHPSVFEEISKAL